MGGFEPASAGPGERKNYNRTAVKQFLMHINTHTQ